MQRILELLKKQTELTGTIAELRADYRFQELLLNAGLHRRDDHGKFFDPSGLNQMKQETSKKLIATRAALDETQSVLAALIEQHAFA